MTLHWIAVETPQKHILRNDQRVESAALGLSGTAKCVFWATHKWNSSQLPFRNLIQMLKRIVDHSDQLFTLASFKTAVIYFFPWKTKAAIRTECPSYSSPYQTKNSISNELNFSLFLIIGFQSTWNIVLNSYGLHLLCSLASGLDSFQSHPLSLYGNSEFHLI